MSQPVARQPIPVGKFFLDRGKISPQQLEIALQHRAEFRLKLGQSLVELGFVTEADMVEALRYQARFPCIHLTSGIVEARVAAKVGETVSRRLRALALNQVAGHTTVALEDPSDAQALEELAHILGTRLFPVYAEPSAIAKLIDQVFGPPKGPRPAPKVTASPASPMRLSETTGLSRTSIVPRTSATSPASLESELAAPVEAAPDERAVVERVRALLLQAFEQGVSDIHLEARRDALHVRFRSEGVLREHSKLPSSWARPAVACLKALAKLEAEEGGAPKEGSIPFLLRKQHLEVRVATTPSAHGESAVLHVVGGERAHRGLAQLGLGEGQLEELEPFFAARPGLLLVGGPPGSGRTTTLYALVERLARRDQKVVALDGDVAHELEGVLQVRVDPRAGFDHAAGARALLRQDPDLLVVGEVADPATARCLLDAALTGHGVLAALRADGALEVLTQLVRLGCEPYLLAEALRGVVAQRLVRRICAGCKNPTVPDEVLRARLGLAKDGATYHEGEGCSACHGTGYRGQLRLFEVLGMTSGLRRELEKGADSENLARAASADGFRGLREQGLCQARAGLTTLHEVLAATAGIATT